jgi:hypothetical protein
MKVQCSIFGTFHGNELFLPFSFVLSKACFKLILNTCFTHVLSSINKVSPVSSPCAKYSYAPKTSSTTQTHELSLRKHFSFNIGLYY